jgi:muconolactone delta-isomerase
VKILAIEQETAGSSADDFKPLLQAEAKQVWKLYQQGIIRELYFHRDEHVAVLMLECQDVDEASQTLSTLPLVQAGLIAFQVIPLAPYDGFARLFGDKA